MKIESEEAQQLTGRSAKSLGWTDVSVYERAKAIDNWFEKSAKSNATYATLARSVYDAAHPYTHYTASTLRHGESSIRESSLELHDLRLTLVASYICLSDLSFFSKIFWKLTEDERSDRASELILSVMDEH
jgi:hypothetical protein